MQYCSCFSCFIYFFSAGCLCESIDVLVRAKISVGKARKCFFSLFVSCLVVLLLLQLCRVWLVLSAFLMIYFYSSKKRQLGPRSCRYATLENLIDRKVKQRKYVNWYKILLTVKVSIHRNFEKQKEKKREARLM